MGVVVFSGLVGLSLVCFIVLVVLVFEVLLTSMRGHVLIPYFYVALSVHLNSCMKSRRNGNDMSPSANNK